MPGLVSVHDEILNASGSAHDLAGRDMALVILSVHEALPSNALQHICEHSPHLGPLM